MGDPRRLSKRFRSELETQTNTIFFSAISVAELVIKSSLGKLEINFDPVSIARETGFELLSFSADAALQLKDLPFHHRDPFDRMLIVQALSNNLCLMTEDSKFSQYQCQLLA